MNLPVTVPLLAEYAESLFQDLIFHYEIRRLQYEIFKLDPGLMIASLFLKDAFDVSDERFKRITETTPYFYVHYSDEALRLVYRLITYLSYKKKLSEIETGEVYAPFHLPRINRTVIGSEERTVDDLKAAIDSSGRDLVFGGDIPKSLWEEVDEITQRWKTPFHIIKDWKFFKKALKGNKTLSEIIKRCLAAHITLKYIVPLFAVFPYPPLTSINYSFETSTTKDVSISNRIYAYSWNVGSIFVDGDAVVAPLYRRDSFLGRGPGQKLAKVITDGILNSTDASTPWVIAKQLYSLFRHNGAIFAPGTLTPIIQGMVVLKAGGLEIHGKFTRFHLTQQEPYRATYNFSFWSTKIRYVALQALKTIFE